MLRTASIGLGDRIALGTDDTEEVVDGRRSARSVHSDIRSTTVGRWS